MVAIPFPCNGVLRNKFNLPTGFQVFFKYYVSFPIPFSIINFMLYGRCCHVMSLKVLIHGYPETSRNRPKFAERKSRFQYLCSKPLRHHGRFIHWNLFLLSLNYQNFPTSLIRRTHYQITQNSSDWKKTKYERWEFANEVTKKIWKKQKKIVKSKKKIVKSFHKIKKF